MTDLLGKFGVHGTFVREYLGIAFLMIAAVVACVPATHVGAAAEEETTGRIANLVAQPTRRSALFAGRIGWNPPYLYDRKLRDRLRRISCPTTVVWGREDHLVPPTHGEVYAQGIPGARLEIIDGAGHSPHLEQPEKTAELVAG